jgi:hypothetical protein
VRLSQYLVKLSQYSVGLSSIRCVPVFGETVFVFGDTVPVFGETVFVFGETVPVFGETVLVSGETVPVLTRRGRFSALQSVFLLSQDATLDTQA